MSINLCPLYIHLNILIFFIIIPKMKGKITISLTSSLCRIDPEVPSKKINLLR